LDIMSLLFCSMKMQLHTRDTNQAKQYQLN
jgi:hypothetical protein